MCIKKDGLQCNFNAKGDSKYCGRHQACVNDVSTARGFTIKRKSAVKPTATHKSATTHKSTLKTVKRFPVTKVKEYLRTSLPKANLDKLTLGQLRGRAEKSLGVDLSTPEFKPRFKQLVVDAMH